MSAADPSAVPGHPQGPEDESSAADLLRIGENDPTLEFVNWRHYGVNVAAVTQLAIALRTNTYVTAIDLSLVNPGVTDQTLALLEQAIPFSAVAFVSFDRYEFQQLNLPAPGYSAAASGRLDIPLLANFLAAVARNDPSITEVDWGVDILKIEGYDTEGNTAIDEAAVCDLARALRYNTHVRTVDLRCIYECSDASFLLLEAAVRFPLCAVTKVCTHFDDDCTVAEWTLADTCLDKSLAKMFANDPSEVEVVWNFQPSYHDFAAEKLAKALDANTHVRRIDINCTMVSDIGLIRLADAIPNSAVATVELSPDSSGNFEDNPELTWSDRGTSAVFLACLPNLLKLVHANDPGLDIIHWGCFGGTVPNDRHLEQLADALSSNTHVRTIKIVGEDSGAPAGAWTKVGCALIEKVISGAKSAVNQVQLCASGCSTISLDAHRIQELAIPEMVRCDARGQFKCTRSIMHTCQRNRAAQFSRLAYRPLQRLLLATIHSQPMAPVNISLSLDLLDEIVKWLAASPLCPRSMDGEPVLPLEKASLMCLPKGAEAGRDDLVFIGDGERDDWKCEKNDCDFRGTFSAVSTHEAMCSHRAVRWPPQRGDRGVGDLAERHEGLVETHVGDAHEDTSHESNTKVIGASFSTFLWHLKAESKAKSQRGRGRDESTESVPPKRAKA